MDNHPTPAQRLLTAIALLFVATWSMAHEPVAARSETSYIITIDDPADTTRIAAHLRSEGIAVAEHYERLGLIYAHMTDSQAARVAVRADVLAVDADERISVPDEGVEAVFGALGREVGVNQAATWGQDRLDQPELPLDGFWRTNGDGRGAVIYVIDTGVSPHPEFGDRLADGVSFLEDGDAHSDCAGHGTHVASVAAGRTYGIAPLAAIVPVRVLDCDGVGTVSDAISAMDWIAQQERDGRAGVVNMSFIGGANRALDAAAVRLVSDFNLVVVAAAGNNGGDACNGSPGRADGVVTVGASNSTDAIASFSNRGPCADMYAPGTGIAGADWRDPNATRHMNGTSSAAPHVTGLAAITRTLNPELDAYEVSELLVASAKEGIVTDPDGGPPGAIAQLASWSHDARTPANFSAQLEGDRVLLSWDGVEHAHSYRAQSDTGHTCSTSDTRCTIDGLSFDDLHLFTVVSLDENGDTSPPSDIIRITTGAGEGFDSQPLVPIEPVRVLDTRNGTGTARIGKLTHGQTVAVHIPSRIGPTDAVALNITATETLTHDGHGYLTVHPCGSDPSGTSTLNYTDNQTVANFAVSGLDSDGYLCVTIYGGGHVIVDLTARGGWGLYPLAPTRALDTRHNGKEGRIGGATTVRIDIATHLDKDPGLLGTVIGNLTLTETESGQHGGYAYLYPCADGPQNTSNTNFTTGESVAVGFVTAVDDTGSICIGVFGEAHVIVDITGWSSPHPSIHMVRPGRAIDTRLGSAVRFGTLGGSGSISRVEVLVPPPAEIDGEIDGALLNLTLTDTIATQVGGFATVWPCGERPNTSTTNFTHAKTVANFAVAGLSERDTLCFYIYGGAHLIVDVVGYIVE